MRRPRVGRNAADYELTFTVLKCFSKINASLYLFVCDIVTVNVYLLISK